MTLTIDLTAEDELQLAALARRRGVPAADLVRSAVRVLFHAEPLNDRLAAIRSLLNDDAQEQKETGDYLLRAIDDDRLSHRPLYS